MSNISMSFTGELIYKTGYKFIVIPTQDLLCAEYQDDQCNLVLQNGDKYVICCPLKELLDCLPPQFITVNRNILINMKFIKTISKSFIELQSGEKVKISIRKRRLLLKKWLLSRNISQINEIEINTLPRKVNAHSYYVDNPKE